MDSLTQIVLGGAVAAVAAPAEHRRAALLAGAALGTLPDLDSLPLLLFSDDPVARLTLHRSVSHSLLVLPWVGLAIWAWCRRRGKRVAAAPRRWWWAIVLALVTHPLLDAFTVYGTQLWWPLPPSPTMWSSLFIVDPLYTLWLLAACLIAWFAPRRRLAQWALVVGLVVSCAYAGWSLLAKSIVEARAQRALAALGLGDAPRLSMPMPGNTVLWRVVAMTPHGYLEGFHSLAVDRPGIDFCAYRSDRSVLRTVGAIPAVQRLHWFSSGFLAARVVADELHLVDLRMGREPDHFFGFAVARRDSRGHWQPLQPAQRLPAAVGIGTLVGQTWRRLWHQPALLSCAAGGTPAIRASK